MTARSVHAPQSHACRSNTPVTPALALPAPMSEQELVDKSDIVAVVRVLSVSCTAITKDEKTGQELPAYLAKVRLIARSRRETRRRATRSW